MFLPNYSTIQHSPRRQQLAPLPEELRRKVNHIARLNLKEQDLDICACEECIYARQLHRKHPIKLDLSKHSSYRQSYQNRSLNLNNQHQFVINPEHTHPHKRSSSPVVNSSNYLTNFTDRQTSKIIKPKPIDELKFKGPVQRHSSYAEEYPDFRNNANPYVKPVEVFVPNSQKMNIQSVYRSEFNGQTTNPSESGKQSDHLKGGLPWTGSSTYKQLFTTPASRDPQSGKTSVQLLSQPSQKSGAPHLADSSLKDGNYKHQYQTTYRKEYLSGRKYCAKGSSQTNKLLESLQF